jgi:cation:H+ antiporter
MTPQFVQHNRILNLFNTPPNEYRMLHDIIFIGVGFALLVKGSDYFVTAAAGIARRVGVSELIIGLTLVSMGTTLPEFMASITASYMGSSGIAVGNAVGSDITNILLILGTCMVIKGYTVGRDVLKRYGLTLLVVCLVFSVFAPGGVSRIEGGVLVVILPVYLWTTFKGHINNPNSKSEDPSPESVTKLAIAFVGGLLAVIVGARFLVDSSLNLAEQFHILESAIGSTIVALGTSLPEFVVSVRAVTKGHGQISVGNILGANTLNILWVMGVSALIRPLTLDTNLLYFNTPLMIGVTVLLLMFMRMGYQLKRWQGVVFLVLYAVFVVYNYM